MHAKESLSGKDQQSPTHTVNPIRMSSHVCESRFLTMSESVSKPNSENPSETFA